MNDRIKFGWGNALTLALLLTSIALLIGVFHGGARTVPFAVEPAAIVGTARPAPVDLEDDFQADEALLAKPIPLSVFRAGQTLHEALRAAAEAAHCQLRVQWKPIEAATIYRDDPIASEWLAPASADQIPLRTALRWILSDLNGLHDTLDFTIDHGAILVTTADEVGKQTIVVVYNIRDLIDAGISVVPGPSRQVFIDQICGLIKDTVARESWTENGGTIGQIREMMGLLTITQTRANHLELFELLTALRRASRMQPGLAGDVEPIVAKPTSNSIPPELQRKITLELEDQVTCEGAIRELASAAGINIFIDWKSFLPLELSRSTLIHDPSPLSGVSTAEAIREILVPDDDINVLSFSVHDGMIAVALDRTTEVYNVRDLEGSLPSSSGSDLDPVVALLTRTVDPTLWDGHAQHLPGLLVVTQTRAVQVQVAELLRKLRQAKAAKHNE